MSDWIPAYEAFKVEPTPDRLNAVVQTLEPTINQAVVNYGGDTGLLKPKARLLAAEAIKKYDPASGAALPTWVQHQMAPLARYRRLNNQTIKVPEGMQLDGFAIHRGRLELQDKLGRDPDLEELADHVGLSVSRIRAVQRSQIRTPGASAAADGMPETLMTPATPDYTDEALDSIYSTATAAEKAILEARFGAGGAPEMSTQELMRRTKMSPFQLSRKTTALRLQLERLRRDLETL